MKELSLLAVVFALIPGYIADLGFRACWGAPKGDEFDRSLRSIIWSTCGLAIYCTVWGGPPVFIKAVLSTDSEPVFNWALGLAFVLDVAFSTLAAFLVGWLTARPSLRARFEKAFGRSPTFEAPWDALWSRYDKGRGVRIILKDGSGYLCHVLIASNRTDEQELVLRDPSRIEKDGTIAPMPDTRLVYLRNDEIREIHLSVTAEEIINGRRAESLKVNAQPGT